MKNNITMTGRRKFISKLLAMGGGSMLGASKLGAAESGAKKVSAGNADSAKLPTACEVDVCVLGGSCTGVFAAVRAARLGAKVALVEQTSAFGGVATNGLVNVWHSFLDTHFEKPIIAGLSQEMFERLKKRDAVKIYSKNEAVGFSFNPFEMKIELDEMVLEAKVRPFLHALFSEPYYEDGKLAGVIIDGKSGRRIIRAKCFVDATGDGDLCHRMGFGTFTSSKPQPPTTCALFENWHHSKYLGKYGAEFNIPAGFPWGGKLPGAQAHMVACTRVIGKDQSNADELTFSEMEGRRQIRAITDMDRKYDDGKLRLIGLPSYMGVRESRHISCLHKITKDEAFNGIRYADAICNGSYRFDIHHQDKPGVTFYYLNGKEQYHPGNGEKRVWSTWREKPLEVEPTFYQVPLRSLIPQGSENVICAGRMLDADMMAFSGIRVMVNMNQLGEAAGVTACLAAQKNCSIPKVDAKEVRETLAKGGSIII